MDGSSVRSELLAQMAQVLRHRGPDDEGYLLANTSTGKCEPMSGDGTVTELKQVIKKLGSPTEFHADLGLAHRRLSIVDLSSAGHQPMSNEDGTIWIIHNGEIYNYMDLKEELKNKGHIFRSNTDTEVILHSYEEWGVECLDRFNGMWAFVVWDGRKRKLFCSRDRFGIKPFYYYFDGRKFLFASEIKALLEADFVKREPNERLVYDYLARVLVDHTEETFFAGIKQLRGGHYLELAPHRVMPEIVCYYNILLGNEPAKMTDSEYAEQFYEIFADAVRLRLVSDVPVGSCLSGGLDSSSIVCVINDLMRSKGIKFIGGEKAQRTFSARYEDRRYDEGTFASDVVKMTGVEANYIYPTGDGLWNDLAKLLWHQEEPFGSTSIYAQWEVFKLIKQSGVRVALDGQGGDELLAGYHTYFAALFVHLLRTFQLVDLAKELYGYMHNHGLRATQNLLGAAYHRFRQVAQAEDSPLLSKEFIGKSKTSPPSALRSKPHAASIFDWYLYDSVLTTSIPSLLRYEDKNSMAHSIESRVPFLDYRLVEFAFALPWEQKIRQGTTKFILRKAMRGILPGSITDRQDKIGFSTPEGDWFRTTLSNEVAEVINSQRFQQRPYFNVARVKEELEAHQQGRRNIGAIIWRLVNLELWLRMFID